MSFRPMPHTRPQLILMAAVAILVAIAVLGAHIARGAVSDPKPNITIMRPPLPPLQFGVTGRLLVSVEPDGTVKIDWREAERIVALGDPYQRNGDPLSSMLWAHARMLIAVRDGTWEVLDQ